MNSTAKKIVYSISTLSGTIIGVGLFSLPYVSIHSGFWLLIGYFLGIGAISIIVYLLFAEIALKTPDFLRMPGFARFHLGKMGYYVSLVSYIIGVFGVLLVYLIVGGKFLTSILSPFLGGSETLYTVIYFIFGAAIIYFGIGVICRVQFFGLITFFLVLAIIFIKGMPSFEIVNVYSPIQKSNFFFPYGIVLFSLLGGGMDLIPEVEEMLGKDRHLLKKIIPLSIFIPIIAYLSFVLLITGISGLETSEEAINGLKSFFGNGVISLALLFGVLTTFTSFIVIGLTLKKVFWYDLKIKGGKNVAWFITCFIPLALFFMGFDFIDVISFVGAIMIGIGGILILLMYQKIKKERVIFITLPLALIFIGGIIYQLYYFLK
jgi:amino acid permease